MWHQPQNRKYTPLSIIGEGWCYKYRMKLKRAPARVVVVVTAVLCGILSNSAYPIEREGNRLLHNGKEIWLGGIDFQSMAVHPEIDSNKALDQLQGAGLNKVRIWAYPWFMGQKIPIPWSRDQDGKADLDNWNEEYWTTVKNFVTAAKIRGIVVEYTLFAPRPAEILWWAEFDTAWNTEANTNNILAANSDGHAYPEFYDLEYPALSNSGKRLYDYQRALVDKSIQELGEFNNLFFEIANEFPADFQNRGFLDTSAPWALHWADYIAKRTERLVAIHAHDSSGSHLRGLNHYLNRNSVDILNFHFYTGPSELAALVTGIDRPKNQILQSNESHAFFDSEDKLNSTTREAWAAYLSGMHYSFFFRDKDATKIFGHQWEESIIRLTTIHDFASSFPVSGLSDKDQNNRLIKDYLQESPVSNAQWLAASFEDSAYIFYFWATEAPGYLNRIGTWLSSLLSSEPKVVLNLPCRPYEYHWIDANEGDSIGEGSVTDCPASIPAPAEENWDPKIGLALRLEAL